MYSDLPPRWKWANRVTLALGWFAVFMSGLHAALFPPTTITAVQHGAITLTWVTLVIGSSVPAIFGVLSGRNTWEGVSAWFATAGIGAYASSAWALVGVESITRSTQAWALTALVFFTFSRAMASAAHTYRMKRASQRFSGR